MSNKNILHLTKLNVSGNHRITILHPSIKYLDASGLC
jgi:hypothetical protein